MNEIESTAFQIKPTSRWPRTVQFMNYCFDLESVRRITPVKMVAAQLYRFEIDTYDKDPIVLAFETKYKALKAQRELARAYTQTGEFYDKPEDTPITATTSESGETNIR